MPVQQRLQDRHRVGLTRPGGGLHEHGLVELVDRAVDVVQPPHDRGRDHRPGAVIESVVVPGGHRGHPGESGHRLLDENITRTTHHARRPRAGRHLQRGDAVAAQVEERVVRADLLHAEDLGVDAGQDLLDGVGGRPVRAGGVFRRGQGPGVQFAIGGQGQRVDHDDRGGHHVGREPLGEFSTDRDGVGRSGDVTDQPLAAAIALAGDHDRLPHPVDGRQGGLDLAGFNAIAADLDLRVGTAEVAQLPVLIPAHAVAGAIHP